MRKIPSVQQCDTVARLLKTLAHPNRFMILCQLSDGPKTVSELEALTKACQSAVSQFLIRMKHEGLVVSQRAGQNVVYKIADSNIQKLLQALYRIYCR